jgi:hypothetical protein
VYIEKYRIFSKPLFAVKTARQRFGNEPFDPVKVESVLELNTKVMSYEILHMLTKI